MKHRAEAMIDPATDRIILTIARHGNDGGDAIVEVADGWDCGSRAIEWHTHDIEEDATPYPAAPTCSLSIEEAEAIQDALDRVLRAHRDAQPSAAPRTY